MTYKSVALLRPASVLQHSVAPLVLKTRRKLNQPTAHVHNITPSVGNSLLDDWHACILLSH